MNGARRIPAALLAAAILALPACGEPAPAKAIAAADVQGDLPADIPDTVDIGVPSSLTTLDPNKVVQEVDVMAMALISGTLLRSTSATPAGHAPALARECAWRTDTAYRCTLREGGRFSDGTPITSADVVASVKRAVDDPANANGGLVANLAGVAADDPATVTFTLKRPQAAFPLVLTEGPLGVFPAAAAAKPGYYDQLPVSAGPYSLASRTTEALGFQRNPNYPADLAPVLPKITFVRVVDAATRALQLGTGQLDVVFQVPVNLATQVKAPAQAYATSQYGSLYIYMNHRAGPLGDPRVRKAISLAVDRAQINQIAFNGQSRVIAGFFPTTMEGHDPDASTARDLPGAQAMLRGTACEKGCVVEMMQRAGYPPYDTIGTVVAANLKEVGIQVKIATVDQATANSNEGSGNFQTEIGGLYDVVNSPELIMLTYGLTPGGGIDSLFSHYDSPRINELYAALIAAEGEARKPILDEINAIFAEDMPYVPLTDFTTTWASSVSPRVIAFTRSGSFQVGTEREAPGQ